MFGTAVTTVMSGSLIIKRTIFEYTRLFYYVYLKIEITHYNFIKNVVVLIKYWMFSNANMTENILQFDT